MAKIMSRTLMMLLIDDAILAMHKSLVANDAVPRDGDLDEWRDLAEEAEALLSAAPAELRSQIDALNTAGANLGTAEYYFGVEMGIAISALYLALTRQYVSNAGGWASWIDQDQQREREREQQEREREQAEEWERARAAGTSFQIVPPIWNDPAASSQPSA